jgi:hypothetical protein
MSQLCSNEDGLSLGGGHTIDRRNLNRIAYSQFPYFRAMSR